MLSMSKRLFTMEKPGGASTCRTSSGSIVSSNEDLMVNILSRLPVKALSRFKCVSKQWNMLISDPYFVSAHQYRATQDCNIVKMLWVDKAGLIRVCSIEEKEEMRIVAFDLIWPNYPDAFPVQAGVEMVGYPCNGLICLTAGGETLVCNPATRSTVAIPRGNKREYNYMQGLGFCSSSNEFKVVRLFDRSELDMSIPKHSKWYGCELFTVGQNGPQGTDLLQHSRSWRHVGNLPYQIVSVHNTMCYVNGSVHWIVDTDELGYPSSYELILSLDLELEEFKIVSCPEHQLKDARHDSEVHLKEFGGELCYVVTEGLYGRKSDIWVLKDYSNSIWSKEYHINMEEYPSLVYFSVVGICSRRLLLVVNDGRVCYFDPSNNYREEVVKVELRHLFSWELGIYVESPVIPF